MCELRIETIHRPQLSMPVECRFNQIRMFIIFNSVSTCVAPKLRSEQRYVMNMLQTTKSSQITIVPSYLYNHLKTGSSVHEVGGSTQVPARVRNTGRRGTRGLPPLLTDEEGPHTLSCDCVCVLDICGLSAATAIVTLRLFSYYW